MQSLTITLPEDVQVALDAYVQEAGVSRDDIVSQAVKEHLFLRRFHSLQERMSAQARSQGIISDQDVFDRVS